MKFFTFIIIAESILKRTCRENMVRIQKQKQIKPFRSYSNEVFRDFDMCIKFRCMYLTVEVQT